MGEYGRNWRKLSGFYGASGRPAPRLVVEKRFIPKVDAGEGGTRTVFLSPFTMKQLHSRKYKTRRSAVKTLAHEWAHVFQSPETLYAPTVPGGGFRESRPAESGAYHFSGNVLRRMDRKRAIKRAHQAGNQPRVRAFKRRRVEPLDVLQFGSNYGADPRTIRWPGV